LLGKRVGLILSLAVLLGACILFYLGGQVAFLQAYGITLSIRVVAVYLTIVLMAFLSEVVREKVQKQLVSEIDDKKKIENVLRNNESFLDDIIESVQDGISVLNTDLTIRHTNSVMQRWYEQNLPLIGKKCHECYHNQMIPCDPCPTLRCLQSGKTERQTLRGFPGSQVEWLEVFSFPIKEKETGKITGAVEFVRDITNSKQLEQELAHANKMEAVGTLAGGVAHDLNNILSGIVSYPDLLLVDLPDDSPFRGPIETMQASGKKAAAIVQDLLTLARRGVSSKEVINLNEIILSFYNSPEFSTMKNYHQRVRFDLDLQPDLLNMVGSQVHLSKTIMNLVSNAAEAIENSGIVQVITQNIYIDGAINGYEKIPDGEYVLLTVTDSGSGISPEDMEKLFEPFFTKKKMGRSGTGLGMAVVWGTVKDLNGFVDIKSTSSMGTSFYIYFPITREILPQKKEETPLDKYMGTERLLIVDDIEEQRTIASAMLGKLGYTVDAVSSGERAIEFLKNNTVDLVILDMIMNSGIDGLETYKRIIKDRPGQKAIIASGFSETSRVKKAQEIGAGEYVRKPYTLEKLGLTVRSELKK